MEQDIDKIINDLEMALLTDLYGHITTLVKKEDLEHLIKAYKELEEYYEEQNEVNANSIPVSLVEEKILNPMKEEHDKAIKGFIKRDIPQCIEDGGIAQELGYFIGKIEELLEKRK